MLEVTLASLQQSDQTAVGTVGFHFELPAVQTPNTSVAKNATRLLPSTNERFVSKYSNCAVAISARSS